MWVPRFDRLPIHKAGGKRRALHSLGRLPALGIAPQRVPGSLGTRTALNGRAICVNDGPGRSGHRRSFQGVGNVTQAIGAAPVDLKRIGLIEAGVLRKADYAFCSRGV